MINVTTTFRPLGTVAKVISGFAFKSADFGDAGIPVIKIKNIRVGSVDLSETARVNERFLSLEQKYHVKPGDLLVSLTGSHLTQPNSVVGRVARMGQYQAPCLLNQRAGKIFLREGANADITYLYYVLSTHHFSRAIAVMASGAASQANVSPTQVESLEIPIPDLPTQRKIAEILSAYDDLIENNLRRIRILEEMAQSLYREWFVHFRFPGHESTPMVDSPLGPIPEGWEVRKLGDECELTMGQSPKSEFYNDRGEGTPFHQGVTNFGEHFPTDRLFSTAENRVGKEGDVLFSVRAPVGRINVANKRIVIGRGVSAIRHAKGHQSFLLFQLKHLFQEEDSIGNGAIFKAVTKADMENIELIVPNFELINRFEKVASLVFANIKNLTARNETLRQTRDLLLPKLLSGQMTLDVADSDAAETVERPAPTRPASRAAATVAISTTPQRTVTATPPKSAAPKPDRTSAPKTDSPPPIDEINRIEVLCAIRKLFNDGGWRDRETTLKELSAALGYGRLGSHIREVLSTDLLTAVRRGILTSEAGEYALAFRSITELPRDPLKDRFLTAIGRPWISRDDATRAFARSLGYARTGEQIAATARSLINGLLREGRLESDGELIRRT